MVLNQNEYTMTSLDFNYQKPPLFLPNQTRPPFFLINITDSLLLPLTENSPSSFLFIFDLHPSPSVLTVQARFRWPHSGVDRRKFIQGPFSSSSSSFVLLLRRTRALAAADGDCKGELHFLLLFYKSFFFSTSFSHFPFPFELYSAYAFKLQISSDCGSFSVTYRYSFPD